MTNQQTPPRSKDIVIGKARVIWAPAWAYLPEGWVLPGGRRTEDFAEAHGVAVAMDALMRGER